jgi:valyl-tRNA synthetase
VRVPLEGDALRIFEAVVRPGEDGQGDLEAEVERVRAEIERGEKMLANDSFRVRAPVEVVEAEEEKLAGYRAELDALQG